ncbi:MAG: hypothetical protein KJ049_10945 [Gammaproteobacteria bacterium]|nr:hypothetical protein [Gammaproteobacteria bacterium]
MANPKRYAMVSQSWRSRGATEAEAREWLAAELQRLADRFTAGDSWALFMAVDFCAREKIPLPEWFAQRFRGGMNRYQSAEVRHLGEAFGITRPKGWSHAASKRWHQTALPVFYWVEAAREGGATIPEVFELAGKAAGISSKLAEEYYYAINSNQHPVKD